MIVADIPLWFFRTLAITLGLLWGSFLNVVIYRVPLGLSVVRPPSHCPGCGKPVKPYDNIPVISYLVLRGRARCCGTRMSPRYLVVEIMGGALSAAVLEALLHGVPLDYPLHRFAAIYAAHFALVLGLLAAAFIDAEHMILPDPITIGGAVLGVATASLRGTGLRESLVGGFVGFVVVWFPFVFLYERFRGRAGMGMGDAKLTMLAGAWFGWPGAAFVLFGGAVQGTVGALVILAVKGKIEEPAAVRADREELKRAAEAGDEEAKEILAEDPIGDDPETGLGKARLPFGPFLILACFEYLFCGTWISRFFLRGF